MCWIQHCVLLRSLGARGGVGGTFLTVINWEQIKIRLLKMKKENSSWNLKAIFDVFFKTSLVTSSHFYQRELFEFHGLFEACFLKIIWFTFLRWNSWMHPLWVQRGSSYAHPTNQVLPSNYTSQLQIIWRTFQSFPLKIRRAVCDLLIQIKYRKGLVPLLIFLIT